MARELPRTIRSLSEQMQRGVTRDDYEIIVVDNGSTPPVAIEDLVGWGAAVEVLKIADPMPSPASAINQGISEARGELVGVMIDGARLASPGLLATAIQAARLHPNPVIGSLGFHLGPDVQRKSIRDGYDQEKEDQLLDSVDWTANAYRLFDISVFASSSKDGWFAPMAESNALFMMAPAWRTLGGYDEAFQSAGGGLVNLDTWKRACSLPNAEVITLLGEGTFHQIHGGIATNALESPWPEFHSEYIRVRGHPFEQLNVSPVVVGAVHPSALQSLAWSAHHVQTPGG